jgi:hypothetical protein
LGGKEDNVRSTQLSLEQYNSDKIANQYLERYDPILEPWLQKKIVLLELGVYQGGSLLLWRDYFPQGTIVGIDIRLPPEFRPPERVHVYQGSQADPEFLSRVAQEVAPDGFDIIIDDASHVGELTKLAFWHLFDHHLKPHGLYVIEDWGTGYWDDWPDGKSLNLKSYLRPGRRPDSLSAKIARKLHRKTPMRCHSYGMVGFIKQLVDEQGAYDATRQKASDRPGRRSKFESLVVTPSIVFVRKANG